VNVPDPANPKVRDAFFTHLGQRATIATVGKMWVLAHYSDGIESPSSRSVVATWTPAPPPLITEDVTLYVYDDSEHICADGSWGDAAATIILHPGGTYTEVPA
jgi:hypothetical protein